jgi:hypothetical protein
LVFSQLQRLVVDYWSRGYFDDLLYRRQKALVLRIGSLFILFHSNVQPGCVRKGFSIDLCLIAVIDGSSY